MLGANGLKRSTEIAILNANYIKQKLENTMKSYTKESLAELRMSLSLIAVPLKKKELRSWTLPNG
ncbi:MAG: hypothetical protein CM15mP59_3650 [Flavobacteriaceae bacterium]|nr:MAG: hypothetical protein CM15mP59_3650 [Flavobacteriaceae bacterium]